jgi:DNA polymerase
MSLHGINDIYNRYKVDPAFQKLRDFGSQFVPGFGNHNSPHVLLIGEAPGVMEDIQGRPFVGRAGEKLNEFLREARIDNYYKTNLLKYRPPDNRNPNHEEIAASVNYLLQEIEEINPIVVAPLGRFAMKVLLPTQESITKASGKVFESRWCRAPVVPIIHPGRVLRPGSDSSSIIIRASFQKVREIIDNASEESIS